MRARLKQDGTGREDSLHALVRKRSVGGAAGGAGERARMGKIRVCLPSAASRIRLPLFVVAYRELCAINGLCVACCRIVPRMSAGEGEVGAADASPRVGVGRVAAQQIRSARKRAKRRRSVGSSRGGGGRGGRDGIGGEMGQVERWEVREAESRALGREGGTENKSAAARVERGLASVR